MVCIGLSFKFYCKTDLLTINLKSDMFCRCCHVLLENNPVQKIS